MKTTLVLDDAIVERVRERASSLSGLTITSVDVTVHTVADAGHSWPGGEPLPERIAGPTSSEINATGLTWEFFSRHPMPDHVN